MALMITEDCINCGACEPECPNNAIYDVGEGWRFSDKTSLSGMITTPSGKSLDADEEQEALSDGFYFIVPDKCTECEGFHDEPQCVAACPVDCCVPDPDHKEGQDELLSKKEWMHG